MFFFSCSQYCCVFFCFFVVVHIRLKLWLIKVKLALLESTSVVVVDIVVVIDVKVIILYSVVANKC